MCQINPKQTGSRVPITTDSDLRPRSTLCISNAIAEVVERSFMQFARADYVAFRHSKFASGPESTRLGSFRFGLVSR